MQPNKVIKVISACTILHNIAIMRRERVPPEDESDNSDIDDVDMVSSDSDSDDDVGYDGPENGRLYRDYISNTYF
jgi:hypothetical protein